MLQVRRGGEKHRCSDCAHRYDGPTYWCCPLRPLVSGLMREPNPLRGGNWRRHRSVYKARLCGEYGSNNRAGMRKAPS